VVKGLLPGLMGKFIKESIGKIGRMGMDGLKQMGKYIKGCGLMGFQMGKANS
jgi:hypothetical protein